ncbi:MAG: CRISPR-associated helicase Cas3' [Crenarchaeota archaeon]|nr:CRISPR-associated helicase Cas3' [Thermoproteota archaeon]
MKVDLLEQKYAELLCIKLRTFQKLAIEELLNNAENVKPKPLLVRLPTGYGKTLIGESLLVYEAIKDDWSIARGLTYVLPTRAITHDVAHRLKEHLGKFGIREIKELHGESDATDFYADVSVATFDTFLYSFARRTLDYHLERPAGVIATSYVVFDEAHMLQDEYLYSHSIMSKLVASLYEAGIPVVIMTATLPKCIEDIIFKHVGEPLRVPDNVESFNEDVNSYRGSVKNVMLKEDTDLLGYLESQEFYEELRQVKRVLIIANTVERAVKAFEIVKKRKLNGLKTILLHSRLRLQDRRSREEIARKLLQPEIKCSKCGKKISLPAFIANHEVYCNECKPLNSSEVSSIVVVATQVVEAGLDVSCELLVTEVAPADALIQRVGRCARKKGEKDGTCIILKPTNPEPYPRTLIEKTSELLEKMKDDEKVDALTKLALSYHFVNDSYRDFKPEELPKAPRDLESSMEITLRYLDAIHPFIVDQKAIRSVKARPNSPVFIFAPTSDERIEANLMEYEGKEYKSRYRPKERREVTIKELIEQSAKLSSTEAFFISDEVIRNKIFTLEKVYLMEDKRPHHALLFPSAKGDEYFIARLLYTRPSLLDVSSERKARYYKLEIIRYKKGKRVIIKEGTYVLNPDFYNIEHGFV